MKQNVLRPSKQDLWPSKGLYRTTGWLSVFMLVLIPIQIIVFSAYPPPESVEGYFFLFQKNWLLGLISLDFLYILNNIILIFIYLSLFFRLYRDFPSLSVGALALGLVGIVCYFPSNPVFEILSLSGKYASASPDAQSRMLAAGEALMAGYTGTAFVVYYILNAVALILYAGIMLKSPFFSKKTGGFGMAAGLLMLVPSSVGMVGMVFSLASLVPWAAFLIVLVKDLSSDP